MQHVPQHGIAVSGVDRGECAGDFPAVLNLHTFPDNRGQELDPKRRMVRGRHDDFDPSSRGKLLCRRHEDAISAHVYNRRRSCLGAILGEGKSGGR